MKIESLQNKKVKEWKKLQEKKFRDQTNMFLIEGDHLLKEALKTNCVLEIISDNPSFQKEDIPFYEISSKILKKLSPQKSSTNVLAVCQKKSSSEIDGNICILDHLQDPGNLGTILRSALAFNIKTIILSEDTVDLYNEKVIRSCEGMIFHLNIIRTNLSKIIPKLKTMGYHIYGTSVINGTSLQNVKFQEKIGVIIGNEGKGMNPELEKYCNSNLYISMNEKCESLNAGIAASIIFYEIYKKMGDEKHE